MNKKLLTAGLAGALAVTAVVGGSLAYFTDAKEAENTFTVGNVSITLTEPGWEATGKADAETVYAGEPLAKDPTVENVGANPCFVRIKVDGLDQFGDKGDIIYRTGWKDGKLGDNWVQYGDYFYYYVAPTPDDGNPDNETGGVLQPGDITDALFDQIVMPTGLTGSEEAKPITVTAEAVQAQGAKPSWSAVQEMTVADIADWFDTCGMNDITTE